MMELYVILFSCFPSFLEIPVNVLSYFHNIKKKKKKENSLSSKGATLKHKFLQITSQIFLTK